ncbi:hypothetical protein VPH35_001629 [Triticum aestivum]
MVPQIPLPFVDYFFPSLDCCSLASGEPPDLGSSYSALSLNRLATPVSLASGCCTWLSCQCSSPGIHGPVQIHHPAGAPFHLPSPQPHLLLQDTRFSHEHDLTLLLLHTPSAMLFVLVVECSYFCREKTTGKNKGVGYEEDGASRHGSVWHAMGSGVKM